MTKQEFEKAISNPKTYNSKQETIDGIFPIVEYWLKNNNLTLSNGRQVINTSQIILNKPDVKDDKNFFWLAYAYNKIIGRE